MNGVEPCIGALVSLAKRLAQFVGLQTPLTFCVTTFPQQIDMAHIR